MRARIASRLIGRSAREHPVEIAFEPPACIKLSSVKAQRGGIGLTGVGLAREAPGGNYPYRLRPAGLEELRSSFSLGHARIGPEDVT
jgi:hypothetical protein